MATCLFPAWAFANTWSLAKTAIFFFSETTSGCLDNKLKLGGLMLPLETQGNNEGMNEQEMDRKATHQNKHTN